MRHCQIRFFANSAVLLLAASLILICGSCGESPAKSLTRIENSYADFLDHGGD